MLTNIHCVYCNKAIEPFDESTYDLVDIDNETDEPVYFCSEECQIKHYSELPE